MDGREIVGDLDAFGLHFFENFVALLLRELFRKLNDENEPAKLAAGRLCGDDNAVVAGEDFLIPFSDLGAFGNDFVDAGELDDAEGAVDVAETVIVAEAFVAEPGAGFAPALIAEGDADIGQMSIVGENHTALAGRDLLIGVECKDGHFAEGSCLSAVQFGAEGLAAVLDDGEVVFLGDGADFVEVCGAAERLDGKDGLCFFGDCGFDFRGVDVESRRVDIDEDGFCAGHHNNGCGGDECEGGCNDLVAGADFECGEAEEQAAGSAVYGDGAFPADVFGEGVFKFGQLRAERKIGASQDCADGFDFLFGDVGAGQMYSHRKNTSIKSTVKTAFYRLRLINQRIFLRERQVDFRMLVFRILISVGITGRSDNYKREQRYVIETAQRNISGNRRGHLRGGGGRLARRVREVINCGAAGHSGKGKHRAGQKRDYQLRIQVSEETVADKSGAGGYKEGGAGLRFADCVRHTYREQQYGGGGQLEGVRHSRGARARRTGAGS